MAFAYLPFSDKQLEVIAAPLSRINILEGSVRSGKTIASIVRWVRYVGKETSPGAKLLMLGVTADTLKRNVIDDLLDIVGPKHAHYADGTLTLFGRTIHCVGARDVGAEKRIRGLTVEGCYIDEVTQIPQPVVAQSILRCSKGAGRMIWTTNPDSPFHYVHEQFVGNEEAKSAGRVQVWHFTMDDNLALSEEYKADVTAQFTGLWYDRMVLGLWVLAEGIIYDQFNLDAYGFDEVDLPIVNDWDVAIDYGTQNPFAALLIGESKRLPLTGAVWGMVPEITSWVASEFYYSGRESMRQKTDAEYADDLEAWLAQEIGGRPRQVIIDPSAASMIAELRSRGFKVVAASNDVTDGIRTVSGRLACGRLRIHRLRCPNLVREFGVYAWDPKAAEKGEDKPIKKHDHALDACRYHQHTLHGADASVFSFG